MNEEPKQQPQAGKEPPPMRVIDEWVQRTEDRNVHSFLGRHKLVVGIAKFIIVFLILVLIGALLVWPFLVPEEKRFQVVFSSIGKEATPEEEKDAETNTMMKPRFHGVDQNNQPYNVIADEAVQKDEDTVWLKNLSGDITLQDKRWYAISAKEGVIGIKSKQLELTENVSIFTDGGFEVHTISAHADMEQGTAVGEHDVSVQGPPGTLEAKGFKILNRGDEIYFTGPVRMTIYTGRR